MSLIIDEKEFNKVEDLRKKRNAVRILAIYNSALVVSVPVCLALGGESEYDLAVVSGSSVVLGFLVAQLVRISSQANKNYKAARERMLGNQNTK